MKKISLVLASIVGLVSCTNESDIAVPVKEETRVETAKYVSIVRENTNALADWTEARHAAEKTSSRAIEEEANLAYSEIEKLLLPTAIDFADNLEITIVDLEEITGAKIETVEQLNQAILGILLFAVTLDTNNNLSRSGDFLHCVGEAFGIAGGARAVGDLIKGTVSKGTLKAAVKVVARVSCRTLNGIGLALLAAEVAWCMWG